MADSNLRWEAGSPVVIELIHADDAGACRFGYKVGDTWEVSVWENDGLCGLAYNAFFPFITMFQTGGRAVWKRTDPGTDSKDMVVRTCPDMRPGFRFRIKRKGD
jgi:uncharacterized repeat protein (TIGR04076 family)